VSPISGVTAPCSSCFCCAVIAMVGLPNAMFAAAASTPLSTCVLPWSSSSGTIGWVTSGSGAPPRRGTSGTFVGPGGSL
jgi:hypothetical protein